RFAYFPPYKRAKKFSHFCGLPRSTISRASDHTLKSCAEDSIESQSSFLLLEAVESEVSSKTLQVWSWKLSTATLLIVWKLRLQSAQETMTLQASSFAVGMPALAPPRLGRSRHSCVVRAKGSTFEGCEASLHQPSFALFFSILQ
ncbi:hypothetical protein CRG98_023547, partial [Punica granatum]